MKEKERQAWRLRRKGKLITPDVFYKGHRFEHEHVVLSYELQMPNGHIIHVEEMPEHLDTDKGQGLERVFHVSDLPDDTEVVLLTHLASVSMAGIDTDATFEIDHKTEKIIPGTHVFSYDGKLILGNGTHHFTTWLIDEPVVVAAQATVAAEKHPGLEMIDQSDCRSCHNPNVTTIGPSYVDVAKKYATNGDNIRTLTRKVLNGGAGVWGETMMTPHPQHSFDEVRTMITYILTLDGEAPYMGNDGFPESDVSMADAPTNSSANQGLMANTYMYTTGPDAIPEFDPNVLPVYSKVVPLGLCNTDEHFGELAEDHHFYMRFSGFIDIPADAKYDFRLSSDDGSRLMIDNAVVINHDGLHGADAMDGEVILTQGKHPFILDYIENSGGESGLPRMGKTWRK